MTKSLACSPTVFVAEMQRRCWWTLNRTQSRCAEESQMSVLGSREWDDYAMPSNLNDYDLDPMMEVEPRPRPGITDSSLLIIRLEFVRLIESVHQTLTSNISALAIPQCRVLLTEKFQMLHRDYLQYTHESRQRDQFIALTHEVLKVYRSPGCSRLLADRLSKAKVNMMILRQEIIASSYESCEDTYKDDMDDLALTMLECSQTLLTKPAFTPWSWCYTRAQQSYTMAYLLSSLVHRQSNKHAGRARAFLAELSWESWLESLRLEEHRCMLARLYQQVQDLEDGGLKSINSSVVSKSMHGTLRGESGTVAGAGVSFGGMAHISSSSFRSIGAGFTRLEDICSFKNTDLSTMDVI